MPSLARAENCLTKMPLTISIKDPRRRLRVIRIGAAFCPFSHFRRKDVQVTVPVDITHLQAVAVDQVASDEIVPHPIDAVGGLADALIPL